MSSVPSSVASDQWVLLGAMLFVAVGFGIHAVRAERRGDLEEHAAGASAAGGTTAPDGAAPPRADDSTPPEGEP